MGAIKPATAAPPPTSKAKQHVVNTSEQTTGGVFADLATPQFVDIVAPPSGMLLVNMSCYMNNNSGNPSYMGFTITNVRAAFIEEAVALVTAGTGEWMQAGRSILVTGLSPGASYSFRAQFRLASSGTSTFAYRHLSVIPL